LPEEKNRVPIREGLFTFSPSGIEPPHLIGSRCQKCGQAFFPRKNQCPKCSAREMEEVALSAKGKLYTYTVIYQPPPGYVGKMPYAVGKVELPEGERILAPLVEVEPPQLRVGMEMELVIGKAFDDPERGEVLTYQFRPCREGEKE
jgi:uncharacterized OB-fold protein